MDKRRGIADAPMAGKAGFAADMARWRFAAIRGLACVSGSERHFAPARAC